MEVGGGGGRVMEVGEGRGDGGGEEGGYRGGGGGDGGGGEGVIGLGEGL